MPETSSDREQPRDEVSLSDTSIRRMQQGLGVKLMPTRDEASGLTVGGALGIIVVAMLEGKGVTVPVPVAAAIGTVTAQVVHYITSFLPRRR